MFPWRPSSIVHRLTSCSMADAEQIHSSSSGTFRTISAYIFLSFYCWATNTRICVYNNVCTKREKTRESFMILVLLYSLYLYYINNRRTYILRWFVHIFAFSHNLCGTLQNWQINVCGETWNMKWAHKHTSNITSFSTSSSQTTTNIFYMHAGGYNGHTKICVRCHCRNVGERFMSVWLLFEMTWFEVTLSKASETERERAQPMWGVIFILIYSSLIHDFHGWYSVIVVFHSFVLGCWDCLCNVHSIHTMYGNCVLFLCENKSKPIFISFFLLLVCLCCHPKIHLLVATPLNAAAARMHAEQSLQSHIFCCSVFTVRVSFFGLPSSFGWVKFVCAIQYIIW